jgi:hypothetical protein
MKKCDYSVEVTNNTNGADDLTMPTCIGVTGSLAECLEGKCVMKNI